MLAKQLRTVPGVIDVSSFGGLTKQYHVNVDPQKLDYYRVPLSALTAAITNANINAGGNYLDVGEQAFDVRGIGFIESLDDIRNIVLSTNKATPITVGNVAEVAVGYAPRLGIVGMNNHDEVVEGHRPDAQVRQHAQDAQRRGGQGKAAQHSGILPPGTRSCRITIARRWSRPPCTRCWRT